MITLLIYCTHLIDVLIHAPDLDHFLPSAILPVVPTCIFFLIEFTSPFYSLFMIVCVYCPKKEVSKTGLLTTRICPRNNNSWSSAPKWLLYLPDLFDADCDLFLTVQSNRHSGAVSRGVKVQLKQSSTVEVWWAASVSLLFKTLPTHWTFVWNPPKTNNQSIYTDFFLFPVMYCMIVSAPSFSFFDLLDWKDFILMWLLHNSRCLLFCSQMLNFR